VRSEGKIERNEVRERKAEEDETEENEEKREIEG
jgi:hypothetical protein